MVPEVTSWPSDPDIGTVRPVPVTDSYGGVCDPKKIYGKY